MENLQKTKRRRKKKKVSSKDEIFEENAIENNGIPLTEHATQAIDDIIPHPKTSLPPPNNDADHNSRNLTTKDQEPTSEPHRKERKKSKKRKREKGRKSSSVSASPSAPEKSPDGDNGSEEPIQGERPFQDDVFEGSDDEKKGKIPTTPTEHAAQVEGKQSSTDDEELVDPPPVQSSSPSRVDIDGIPEIPDAQTENPSSMSPRKELKVSKKRRVSTKEDEGERATGLVGSRVFTEEDEIAVLKGIIDCGSSLNVSASSISISVLHGFLGGKLQSDFNKTQIYEKIRRLKQKFVKNMEMYITAGKGPFKPHEAMVFELSKKIWSGIGVDYPMSSKHANKMRVEGRDTDVKSKKKSSNEDVAGKLQIKAVATADEGGLDDDDDGKAKAKIVCDDGEVKKKKLLEKLGNDMKKCKLRLELAKLELDEVMKG